MEARVCEAHPIFSTVVVAGSDGTMDRARVLKLFPVICGIGQTQLFRLKALSRRRQTAFYDDVPIGLSAFVNSTGRGSNVGMGIVDVDAEGGGSFIGGRLRIVGRKVPGRIGI